MNEPERGKGDRKGSEGLFDELFVLELANNHWGSVERGKEIIRQHGKVVQETGVKAAIKFQFRDVDSFVHDAFKPSEEVGKEGEVTQAPGSSSRYIKKTIATKLSPAEFAELLAEVRKFGMLTMATPFDEKSVEWCRDLDIDIVKIASQDAKSWVLVERIAELGKPTIISNGGTDIADLDRVVRLFEEKKVPLAINHCVSLYPSEDDELELNQVDYLRKRYPGHVIGYSTHEYYDWTSSVQITYAKGARTWERHIDIEDAEGTPVSKYCSLPHQVREWFLAFKKAKEMAGSSAETFRTITEKEKEYVQSVSRGAYALRDLPAGTVISKADVGKDFEFVIPLQGAQLSSRDLDTGVTLREEVKKGQPIFLSQTDAVLEQVKVGMNKVTITWGIADGITRAAWVLALYGAVLLAGPSIGGLWVLLLSGLLALVVGAMLTLHNQYELYPTFRQALGGFLNGLVLAGVTIMLIGMFATNAPTFAPWILFAASMVTTALVGRVRHSIAGPNQAAYLLSLLLLAGVPALFWYQYSHLPLWLILGYGLIALMIVEQFFIRACRTAVLLPWVNLFWNAVGILFVTVLALVALPFPVSLILLSLIASPMLVGIVALSAALLLVFSVFTRLQMRRAAGEWWKKRAIVVGIVGAAGILAAPVSAFFGLLATLLLLTALAFGDK